jgi:hypothetical protein
MKLKKISLVSFSLVLISCSAAKKENREKEQSPELIKDESAFPYHINLPKEKSGILKASFFADSVYYIPLETNGKSLLRKVTHVAMNDSVIGVSDFKNLFLFKKNGKFIRTIGRRGKGPGEHLYINNVFFNKDTIYIANHRKIIKYSFSGKLLDEKVVNSHAMHFSVTSSGNLACYNKYYKQKGLVTFFNSAFAPTDTLIVEKNVSPERTKWLTYDPSDNFFQPSENKLLFSNYKSDTIWNLSGRKKRAEYILNLKDKLLPWHMQVEYYNGDFQKYKKDVAPYQKINLIETSNCLFLLQKSWAKRDLNIIYIHNFSNKTTMAYEGKYIYDDILGGIKIPTEFINLKEGLMVKVDAMDLSENLEKLNKKGSILNTVGNHNVNAHRYNISC